MKNTSTSVIWWVGWIGLTIGSFFVSCYFWTGFIARHAGGMAEPGVPALWIAAVFGSWMLLLVPLIVVMYQKVDKAYEDARIARENAQFKKVREARRAGVVFVEEFQRTLTKEIVTKLKKMPETIRRGHLVNITLRDGQRIENVFILDRKVVLGIYAAEGLAFNIQDIVDIEAVRDDQFSGLQLDLWLRLDGAGGEDRLTASASRL